MIFLRLVIIPFPFFFPYVIRFISKLISFLFCTDFSKHSFLHLSTCSLFSTKEITHHKNVSLVKKTLFPCKRDPFGADTRLCFNMPQSTFWVQKCSYDLKPTLQPLWTQQSAFMVKQAKGYDSTRKRLIYLTGHALYTQFVATRMQLNNSSKAYPTRMAGLCLRQDIKIWLSFVDSYTPSLLLRTSSISCSFHQRKKPG